MYGNSWTYDKKTHDKIFNTLKYFFPDAKIFMVVRRQDTWMNSIYNHCFRTGWPRTKNINRFFGYKNNEFTSDTINIDINNLNWYGMLKSFEDKFPKENIFVLPYEFFSEDLHGFLCKFYEYYNIEAYYPGLDEERVNTKDKFCSSVLYRLYTHFRERYSSEPVRNFLRKNDKGFLAITEKSGLFKFKIPVLSEKQAAQVLEKHRENNKKLAEYIGMDLSQYGYY